MNFMFACSRCGCVGFHSEACIAATSAERLAPANPPHVCRIDPERLARALAQAEVGCIGFGGFEHGPGNDLTSHRRDAAAIIAAYEADTDA